jgi:hypothetical protein
MEPPENKVDFSLCCSSVSYHIQNKSYSNWRVAPAALGDVAEKPQKSTRSQDEQRDLQLNSLRSVRKQKAKPDGVQAAKQKLFARKPIVTKPG